MSRDSNNDAEVKALRQLIDEVRAAEPPELDWNRVDRSLARRIELEGAARRQRKPKTWGSLVSFAVAAAAAAILLMQLGRSPAPVVPTAADDQPIDLSAIPAERQSDELPTYMVAAMKPRSVVEAGEEPVRFALPGVASWVIAPQSRVVVDTVAVPHVINLERGTIHAEVVPRSSDDELVESFAIVAGNARVAVHGTVFSVVRQGDRITVEVTRGAVTVGPASHRGITTGRLLVSPARAAFSVHGGELLRSPKQAPERPTQARLEQVAGDRPSPADRANSASADVAEVRIPGRSHAPRQTDKPIVTAAEAAETAQLPALTAGQARALVVACLRNEADRTDAERLVTISSQVTALVGENGTVDTVRFSPPLRPDLQERCGAALFHHRTEGQSSLSFHVHVSR